MSRLLSAGRAAGTVGAALGVAAVGAAVGFAAERYVVGRSLRRDDPYADERLGSLRGVPRTVETADGVLLHVEVDGDTNTSPLTVVFTHGYALNQDSWHFQRRDLAGRARLVFWDQRSHGRSGRAPDGSVTFERLARDLGEVIDQTVPDGPLVLVGHSMGGMTVLALAEAPSNPKSATAGGSLAAQEPLAPAPESAVERPLRTRAPLLRVERAQRRIAGRTLRDSARGAHAAAARAQ